jgi:hypothetical protein
MSELDERTNIPPIPMAFLICDQVITDETSKKKTLVGVFDHIMVKQFPARHGPVSLYARLFDSEGTHECKVEYLRMDTQEILGNATGQIQVNSRNKSFEFALNLPAIEIPEPGEYEFQLFLDNRLIHRARLTAIELTGDYQPPN